MVAGEERGWADCALHRCPRALDEGFSEPGVCARTRRGERVLEGQRGDPHAPALYERYYCSNGFSIMGLYYAILDT